MLPLRDPSLPLELDQVRSYLISQVGAIVGVLPVNFADVRRCFASIAADDQLWAALPHALVNLAAALPGVAAATELDLVSRPRGAFADLHVSPGAPGDGPPPPPIWPGPGPAPGDGSGSKGGLS